MDYKVIGRKIPGQPNAPEKYYASIVRPKNVTLDTLSKRIAEISPVNELDTKSVLIAFTKVLPEYLVDGATVELGDLGRLMVTLSSSGADAPEDFKSDMIKGNKVSYQMSTEVKKVMKAAEYEKK